MATVGDCDSCRCEDVAVTEYPATHFSAAKRVCELCAKTMTSTWVDYSHTNKDALEVMRTVCYVGNIILRELRKGGR